VNNISSNKDHDLGHVARPACTQEQWLPVNTRYTFSLGRG